MIVETSQSVGDGYGSQEALTNCHNGLRIRQQREGLRVEHPRPEQAFKVIAESMDLSCGQRSSVEAHRFHAEKGSVDRWK
jgi:hypothetical protein